MDEVVDYVPLNSIAIHAHDSYSRAVANIVSCLAYGVRTFDASVGGLGGCPYAGKNVAGNVATEDVVHQLQLVLKTHRESFFSKYYSS